MIEWSVFSSLLCRIWRGGFNLSINYSIARNRDFQKGCMEFWVRLQKGIRYTSEFGDRWLKLFTGLVLHNTASQRALSLRSFKAIATEPISQGVKCLSARFSSFNFIHPRYRVGYKSNRIFSQCMQTWHVW